ncbi:WD repeat-containing protein 20-like [Oppia nitens]|uniref:WD repeat-containing protein 20-like n=1 Tax=Oppia nitens TaxID=1686743 RepID=UPI0023D9E1D4|nr:WD repeat-containing protein 20-like [Oppia nitens]
MASIGCESVHNNDIKTQFVTREGYYKLMTSAEYSRPNRLGYATQTNNTAVKVSFVTQITSNSSNNDTNSSNNSNTSNTSNITTTTTDRICFNVGRELYVYSYKGVKKAADLTKPVDKRVYKGTYPTCHDFNSSNISSDSVYLLVGFSAGQIQLIDPIKKEMSKLYNEERLIDKTKVTCLKWLPNSPNFFIVSHSSGQMYVYKEDLPCGTTPPHYQIFKQGDGFSVYTCKTKSTRNPIFRWIIGEGSLNEFAFSPCSKYLATVSQDGFLRVFNYDTMELIGRMRSYFGGLLCVCWSPDNKFVVTGGEDDLVTIWSFTEKRVVARGQGHKSWVSVVTFDPFTTSYSENFDLSGSEEDNSQQLQPTSVLNNESNRTTNSSNMYSGVNSRSASTSRSESGSLNRLNRSTFSQNITAYRLGSVGQDTHICLWDLSDDVLKQPVGRSRTSILLHSPSTQLSSMSATNTYLTPKVNNLQTTNCVPKENSVTTDSNILLTNHVIKTNDKKEHKRNFSLGSRNSDKNSVNKTSHTNKLIDDPNRLLGTPICPRLDEVPLLEPLICKKIAHERLTSLVFRDDCFVTACQEGYVCTWARPGKWGNMQLISSPSPSIGAEVNEMLDDGSSTVV